MNIWRNKFQTRRFIFRNSIVEENSFSVNKDAKPASVILGQFERCTEEGLRTNKGRKPMRQGSNTRDTALVHLVPEDHLPPHLANSIGNRTLIVGSNEGGTNIDVLERNLEKWQDAEDHLNGLIDSTSLLSRTTAWPQNLNNPRELRAFIAHRNRRIIDVLNNALEDFKAESFEN